MVRNIVMVKVRPGTTSEQLDEIEQAMGKLQSPGMISVAMRRDLGLREGNMDFVVVSDFVDGKAYRLYDDNSEHGRIRTELVAPVSIEIGRIQVEVDDH